MVRPAGRVPREKGSAESQHAQALYRSRTGAAGLERGLSRRGRFYELCRPLIESTRRVVDELLEEHSDRPIESLYVTGGGSELPPVARILRESYGRRVRRSAYMRSATAIGLAVRADTQSGCVLRERFTRNFGLWREADEGRDVVFDLVFARGTELPGPKQPPLRSVRAYHPAHNVGHFRYLECARLARDGRPIGEIAEWDDIRFPFDPELQDSAGPRSGAGKANPRGGGIRR